MFHGTGPGGDMESGLKINNNKPGFPLAGLNCIYLSVTLALRIGPSLVLVCRESLEVIFTDEIGNTGTGLLYLMIL